MVFRFNLGDKMRLGSGYFIPDEFIVLMILTLIAWVIIACALTLLVCLIGVLA